MTVPLVLPPMVGGVALLFLFGRNGLARRDPREWGIRIPFTTTAVVLAQTFVALPFLVLAVEGSLRTAGVGLRADGRRARRRPLDDPPPRHAAARRAPA